LGSNECHVTSHWRVLGTPEEVFEIIAKAADLPRWWPAAFRDSLPIQTGDETGTARVVRLESRGFLPYVLRWHVVTKSVDRPHHLVNEVWGDIQGVIVWTLAADGDYTTVDSDWRISIHMPLLGLLSPIVNPFYSANHRWAMAKGEESLKLELQRLRAASQAARSQVAQPPAGVERSTWAIALGAGALLALLMLRRDAKKGERGT